MPITYTESKCDACDRQCRAGVFLHTGPRVGGVLPRFAPCPSGVAPVWVVETHEPNQPPTHTLDKVTKVIAVHAGTILLGCEKCAKSPCLLEITGPADTLPCLVFSDGRPAEWFRVTG